MRPVWDLGGVKDPEVPGGGIYKAVGQKRETEAVEVCEIDLGAGGMRGRRPRRTL